MSKGSISAQMHKLVKEYEGSGQSQMAFATSHGLSKGKLHYWVKKLSRSGKVPATVKESPFVPIEITTSPSRKTDQVILIRLTSGVEIEIPV